MIFLSGLDEKELSDILYEIKSTYKDLKLLFIQSIYESYFLSDHKNEIQSKLDLVVCVNLVLKIGMDEKFDQAIPFK